MRAVLIILVFWIGVESLKAQERQLSGKVVSGSDNSPLFGASVYLKSNTQIGTITDQNGNFQLNIPLATANEKIIISYLGYTPKEFLIEDMSSDGFKISLQPENQWMESVEVTAEKLIAEEFAIEKIEKIEVYLNPSAKADPLLAVNSLPSATTTDESANISFRGSSPAETGIYLDNVPIYDAVRFSQLNGIGTFSIFNTAIIDNVQVYPGNPPLEYGGATSGVIALQTDQGLLPKPTTSLAISLANYGVYHSRSLGKKTAFRSFANYTPAAIIKGINPSALDEVRDFNTGDAGLHISSQLSKNFSVSLFSYANTESYTFFYQHPTFQGDFDQRKQRNFNVLNLRFRQGPAEWTINGGLSLSKTKFDYSVYAFDIGRKDYFTSFNYQRFGQKLNVKTGISADMNRFDFKGTFPAHGYAVGEQYPSESAAYDDELNQFEWYGYAKYFFTSKLTGGIGLRKNIPEASQRHFLSSQVNLDYQFSKRLNFKLAVGEYHKYLVGLQADEGALKLDSRQYSFHQKYKKGSLLFSTSLFYKRTNYQQFDRTVLGAEFQMQTKINPKLTGRFTYTYLDAKDENENSKYPSQYDLNYFIKGYLEYDFGYSWTLTSNFVFRSGTYFNPVTDISFDVTLDVYMPTYGIENEKIKYPGYSTIDLSLSKLFPISENLVIVAFANVTNIFDFKNVRDYNYSFDYSTKTESYYSRRLYYFGAVLNF